MPSKHKEYNPKNKLNISDVKCNKKFITQINDDNMELIYICGDEQYGLILPRYINYDKEIDKLLKSMFTVTNYGSMERDD